MSAATKAGIQTLEVVVQRVRHTSDGFSIYTANTDGHYARPLTIKQFAGPVSPGQRWVVCGKQLDDPKWGPQFACSFATLAAPTTPRELELFCLSGLVDGWGWREYGQLQAAFDYGGALAVCRDQPHRLAQETEIAPEAIQAFRAAWQRGTALATVYADLAAWGLSGRVSDAIVRHYGDQAIPRLTEDPYRNLFDIDGYGWRSAEAIARHLDIPPADPRRIKAGIDLAVHEATWQEGHTWLTRHEAIAAAVRLLGLSYGEVERWIDATVDQGHTVQEGTRLYPESLYQAEETIAAQLTQRRYNKALCNVSKATLAMQQGHLSSDQASAVVMALTEPISLLTGGPGVGKTTCLKALVDAADRLHIPVTCMAPTGKAAARMSEATGVQASTIHSRLGITPGSVDSDTDAEPVTGLVIVDEVSMLDTQLAAAMLKRLSLGAQLFLVGDPDQLPSVGPGAVLRDLLEADVLPRVHLDKVFRNDAGIAVNAARIREGQTIVSLDDCQIIPVDSVEQGAYRVMQLLDQEHNAGLALGDILVLCPTNDGPTGRYELNRQLQPVLNNAPADSGIKQYMGSATDPDGTIRKRQEELRRGDRVMVTKNIRELAVFNGQVGIVVDVSVPRSLDVDIDGRVVTFAGEHKRALTLAYAITGHKSQGSEAPVVIAPIFPSRVLSREWLYTVLTRAKARAYLVGDESAIQGCLGVRRGHERKTGLVGRLHSAMEGGRDDG